MGIVEVLQLETDNTGIFLHKEGMFWRAYECSAYLFVNHIKKYNLTKKYYKNVKKEVVYLGFPQNSISGIENLCQKQCLSIKKEEKRITISGMPECNKADFEIWKNSIEKSPVKQLPDNGIIEKLRSFPVIHKSPVECQQFLIEIQSEINGQLH